jgi:hypothetical protein
MGASPIKCQKWLFLSDEPDRLSSSGVLTAAARKKRESILDSLKPRTMVKCIRWIHHLENVDQSTKLDSLLQGARLKFGGRLPQHYGQVLESNR